MFHQLKGALFAPGNIMHPLVEVPMQTIQCNQSFSFTKWTMYDTWLSWLYHENTSPTSGGRQISI